MQYLQKTRHRRFLDDFCHLYMRYRIYTYDIIYVMVYDIVRQMYNILYDIVKNHDIVSFYDM